MEKQGPEKNCPEQHAWRARSGTLNLCSRRNIACPGFVLGKGCSLAYRVPDEAASSVICFEQRL